MAGRSIFRELRRRHVFRVAIAYAVTAWLLLQLGTVVFPAVHAPAWCEGVLLAFLALGFPVAILLAWAFEVTPDGVRRTVPASDESPAPAPQSSRKARMLNAGIIVVLAAALAVLAWRLHTRRGTAPVAAAAPSPAAPASSAIPRKSIAVLPFENLSTDKGNAYFADGMQDLILSKLAEIGGLTVISRTSTMRYQSHPGDLKAIGRQLGVANLLEGSVQKSGDQVLVNVQLIDARNDHHIWAHSYQRTLKNVFGVEGEVAEKVASALKARLDPTEQARVAAVLTRNPDALDAYLRGVTLETNLGLSGPLALKIAAAYRKAVTLDPSFARAWAHLASIDSELYFELVDYRPSRLAQAKAALDRAKSLAPHAIATRIAAGDLAYMGHFDYARALAIYHQVLKVSPSNADVVAKIGYVERREGHWRKAIDYLQRSLALDPRNVNTLASLGWSYACLHRYGKATELLQRALAISPDDQGLTGFLGWMYQSEGDLGKAQKVLAGVKISPSDWNDYPVLVDQALWTGHDADAIRRLRSALEPGNHLSDSARGYYEQMLGLVEQLTGDHAAARRHYLKAVDVLRRAPGTSPLVLVRLAMAQAGLGRKDAALEAIRRANSTIPARYDAFQRPILNVFLAQVQVLLGERSRAIATLRKQVNSPLGSNASMLLTPATLRQDPIWNPLRGDSAFQALVQGKGNR